MIDALYHRTGGVVNYLVLIVKQRRVITQATTKS